MSDGVRIAMDDATLIRIPQKYCGKSDAYADGYIAGRGSAPKMPPLSGKTQCEVDMLNEEIWRLGNENAGLRREALSREGRLAVRLEAATRACAELRKERDELKVGKAANMDAQLAEQRAHNEHLARANWALREHVDRGIEVCDRLRKEWDKLKAELHKCNTDWSALYEERKKAVDAALDAAKAERDELKCRVAELEVELRMRAARDHSQRVNPAPPRPRLFTTAEKDAYFSTCCGMKLFANEISRGWWTIAVDGKPILEDAT